MKITLHELKHLVRQIINEGADDLKELQQLYPNEARVFSSSPFVVNGQPTKWFRNWLVPRFLTGQVQKEFPIEHEVYSIRDYVNNEPAIKAAFGQPSFREALDAAYPPRFRLNNLDDPLRLTVHEMDGILEVFYEYREKKDDRLGIDYDAIDIEGDKLGKIGPWNIWMPTTRENSCAIVRVRDPETGKMKESPCIWCTTRTKESNLFYNYTARPYQNIILYYLIRDNPEIYNKNNKDFISIGFINGVLDVSGIYGGVTVSCDNKGLIENDLKHIFGVDYTSIINLLKQKTKEIGGQHPAKAKLVAAMQSLEGFNYFTKGIGQEEKAASALEILRYRNDLDIDPSVELKCYNLIAKSNNELAIKEITDDSYCPIDILEDLSNISKFDHLTNMAIKGLIVRNPNCPEHIIEKLHNDNKNDYYINFSIISNDNCPEYLLDKISHSLKNYQHSLSPYSMILKIINHQNCSARIIEYLFNTIINDEFPKDRYMLQQIIKNKKTPDDIIKQVCKYSNLDDLDLKDWALYVAEKRGIQLESLRRKIGKLIYTMR